MVVSAVPVPEQDEAASGKTHPNYLLEQVDFRYSIFLLFFARKPYRFKCLYDLVSASRELEICTANSSTLP